MALQFVEGWDLYGTTDNVVIGNWTEVFGTPEIVLTGGKFNGPHVFLDSTGDICRFDFPNIANPNETFLGFQFKADALGIDDMVRWTNGLDSNIEIATLRLTASGAIQFRDGSGPTLLGSTPVDTILAGVWHTCEVRIRPSVNSLGLPTSTGAMELRVDGTVRININNVQIGSVSQGSTTFGKVELRGSSDGYRFDDIYVLDSTGTLNTDFAGDFSVQTLRPNADSTPASWTAVNAGAHFEEVDDVEPDGDATYVSSQESTAADIYELEDLSGSVGSILGYAPLVLARRESGSTQDVGIRLIGASETVSFTAQNVPVGTYEYRSDIRSASVDDVTDSILPTISEVNALKAGVFLP